MPLYSAFNHKTFFSIHLVHFIKCLYCSCELNTEADSDEVIDLQEILKPYGQLYKIFEVLGTPSTEDLNHISNPRYRELIRSMAPMPRKVCDT